MFHDRGEPRVGIQFKVMLSHFLRRENRDECFPADGGQMSGVPYLFRSNAPVPGNDCQSALGQATRLVRTSFPGSDSCSCSLTFSIVRISASFALARLTRLL